MAKVLRPYRVAMFGRHGRPCGFVDVATLTEAHNFKRDQIGKGWTVTVTDVRQECCSEHPQPPN